MCSITEWAVRVDATVLGLTSLFVGSLARFSSLIREPCFLLVGETLFFVFAGGLSSFVVVVGDGGVSMGDH